MHIIKNKNMAAEVNEEMLQKHFTGPAYSKNRFYTKLNQQVSKEVKRTSGLMNVIVEYLFYSSNFIHNSEVSNGKSRSTKIIEYVSWASIVMFFVLLIVGVARPLVTFVQSKFKDVSAFSDPVNIVLFVFTGIFLIISILFLISKFKIQKNNAKLDLDEYVMKKINFVFKIKFLIKYKKKLLGSKDGDIVVLDRFEGFALDNDKWVNLQLVNLVSMIFTDINLVFIIRTLEDVRIDQIKEVVEIDFKNLEVIEIQTQEELNKED